ncbi:nucleoside phosphorylase [Saccharopolyspora sp. NPDC050642]|uniref:nucleoside phosphorylase n=1 Tax=Saccharopolyspora sp. NPDC050642 TaxID=3157099 RepID=UPI003410C6FA
MARRAADPWDGDRPPHLPCRRGELPEICLLPGDPARVDLAAEVLSSFRVLGQNREFRAGTGLLDGVEIGLCSTGIGGPSTEIALVELAGLGVRTVIRIGGMGAMRPEIEPGTLGIVQRARRESGAARHYLPDGDAVPTPAVAEALATAARHLARPSRPITVLSTDSYYLGQGRPLPRWEDRAAERIREVERSGVDGMDMEAETVLAVGRAVGLSVGAVLAVHANRVTDAWLEEYRDPQLDVVRVAATAATILTGRDSGEQDLLPGS